MTKITIDIPRAYLLDGRNEICLRVADDGTAITVVHGTDGGQLPLREYVARLVDDFRRRGKVRLVETYTGAVRSLLAHTRRDGLPLSGITASLMEDYEQRMADSGLSPNTSSFYLRILRAIHRRAVREGMVADTHPFAHVFTGKARTVKRAIALEDLRRLATMAVSTKAAQRARALFLFSYLTRGMSFVDMAHLRRSDVSDGFLAYRRHKTGQQLRMAWRPEMQRMADAVPSLDGIHLLGILDSRGRSPLRSQCHSRQYCVNQSLKRLGCELGLPLPLTMYVARHTWATIARSLNVPLSVISDSMGHHSEKTTRIYLQSIDEGRLDRANDLLIEAVELGKQTKKD